MKQEKKQNELIMAGLVYCNEKRLDKPGEKIAVDSALTVKGKVLPYVSRGGLKLEKALKVFDLDVKDKIFWILDHQQVDLQIVLYKMER